MARESLHRIADGALPLEAAPAVFGEITDALPIFDDADRDDIAVAAYGLRDALLNAEPNSPLREKIDACTAAQRDVLDLYGLPPTPRLTPLERGRAASLAPPQGPPLASAVPVSAAAVSERVAPAPPSAALHRRAIETTLECVMRRLPSPS